MTYYYRPIVMSDITRPASAQPLAGGRFWFDRLERMSRDAPSEIIDANDVPQDVLAHLCDERADMAGLSFDAPTLMGILNVTPDSFSDGGKFAALDAATAHAAEMIGAGAGMIDIGGESTRPGATLVPEPLEIERTAPVIAALRRSNDVPISIDTRKAAVARAAVDAGATLLNDVAAGTFDPAMFDVAVETNTPICLMHALGDPKTMQDAPAYDNVVLDVFDFLAERVEAAVAAGVPRGQIMVDPGIGFGKTTDHCVALMDKIALFHSLGCVVLLGASRKRFIGEITGTETAEDRVIGSVAVALHGMMQGVQLLRVHDIKETNQAIRLQKTLIGM